MPCWEELSTEAYCAAVCELMASVVEQNQEKIERLPKNWKQRILRRVPETRPETVKRSPCVLVHAASKKARVEFREMLRAWLEQYWRASERLRSGCMEALGSFPPNSFPPSLPGSLVADN